VVIGYTVENDTDLWVLKLNSSGEIEWARAYGGPGDDMGYGIDEVEGADSSRSHHRLLRSRGEKLWVLRLDERGDLSGRGFWAVSSQMARLDGLSGTQAMVSW